MRSDYRMPVVVAIAAFLAEASFVALWTFKALKATAH